MAAAAVRVVQVAVLKRHLPEGRLGVTKLHGAHRPTAACSRRTHRLRHGVLTPSTLSAGNMNRHCRCPKGMTLMRQGQKIDVASGSQADTFRAMCTGNVTMVMG